MEYNWTTSVFIGVNGSALAISITLIVVAALVYMAFLPTSKTETQRRKEDGDPIKSPQGRGNPKEDGNPIESPQNDTNRLLRQIEENTRRTKEVSEKFLFWFITLPLVIGAIILITQGCD